MKLCVLYFLPLLTYSLHLIKTLYRNSHSIQMNLSQLIRNATISKQFCPTDASIPIISIGHNNPVVLITCNVHARQVLTTQICVDFINRVTRTQTSLNKQFHFKIIYNGNSQRDRVLEGQYCLRGNKNNVDLNRNFPSPRNTISAKPQNYPGPYPLSQTYSQCVDYLVKKQKPLAYIDIHTGQFSFIYYQNQQKQHEIEEIKFLNSVKQKFCKNCRVVNVATISPELGQSNVYLKQKYEVKYSSIWQVYGGFNMNRRGNDACLSIFTPLSLKQQLYYRQKWTNALIFYLESIAKKIDLKQKVL